MENLFTYDEYSLIKESKVKPVNLNVIQHSCNKYLSKKFKDSYLKLPMDDNKAKSYLKFSDWLEHKMTSVRYKIIKNSINITFKEVHDIIGVYQEFINLIINKSTGWGYHIEDLEVNNEDLAEHYFGSSNDPYKSVSWITNKKVLEMVNDFIKKQTNDWGASGKKNKNFTIQLAPNYTKRITKIPKFLYYIETSPDLDQIFKKGILVNSIRHQVNEPPRIYLALSDKNEKAIYYAKKLDDYIEDYDDRRFDEHAWHIKIKIDTSKLKKGTKFYTSSMFEDTAVYTYSNIPPEAIYKLDDYKGQHTVNKIAIKYNLIN